MMENSKHVRVDNWGVFFLQRLQMFFNKTDYCDLTLQFDGNVQLKVHRLVMNACTEYFQLLEQTCDVVDDNIILMPPDLQADIILPIVNFMYTGTLEYHPTIYERLVQTAELMNIPILIKLLEAHKAAPLAFAQPQKRAIVASPKLPKKILNNSTMKRTMSKPLPSMLPGRKLPVWKRKMVPGSRTTIVPRDRPVTVPSVDNMGSGGCSGVGALVSSYKSQADPPIYVDNTPKPTRFEWPDGENEKMKTETYMESSAFDNLTSYSSLPLIRGEDADKIPVYEELRYTSTASPPPQIARKRPPGQSPYTSRRANQPMIVHRSLEDDDDDPNDDMDPDDPDYHPDIVLPASFHAGGKRAATAGGHTATIGVSKRVRFNEKENIGGKGREKASGSGGNAEIDHSMLIAELLKKYPNLAKTSKNIKLKIMTKPASDKSANSSRQPVRQMAASAKITHIRKGHIAIRKSHGLNSAHLAKKQQKLHTSANRRSDNDGPWICDKCDNPPDPYHLYYLYRKHMTDVHQEQFSPLMCKYCGKRTGSERALSFHMHTVHGASLGNVIGVPFPQCDRCPFAALTEHRLARHRITHNRSHVQCPQCKVGFTGMHALNTHQQITNHISPDCDAPSAAGMTSYDCQYCTRHWQNSATLFVHLKTTHREDARKDGIVSIDEDPEEEEEEEEEDDEEEEEEEEEEQEIEIEEMVQQQQQQQQQQQDDALVEEQLSAGSSMVVDKVKILTDVKVSDVDNGNTVQMQIENAGMTTTLGLVDIVVLDENQQYILQSTNGDLEQSEFILPQITGSFVHQGQQVITTSTGEVHQVITATSQQNITTQLNQRSTKNTKEEQLKSTSAIISTQSGVSSTDELVMVLTDHDYNDENVDNSGQAGPDGHIQGNSNIVVLYSHPVQGTDADTHGQMTCENGASLLVQTAEGQVLEIRNGPPDLVDHSSQQESIEMIERELNNTQHMVLQHSVEQPQHIEQEEEEHPDGDDKAAEEVDQDEERPDQEDGDQEEQQVMLVVAEDDESADDQSNLQQDEQIDESIDAQDGVEYKDKDGHDVCGSQDEPQRIDEPMDLGDSSENQQILQNNATDYTETVLPVDKSSELEETDKKTDETSIVCEAAVDSSQDQQAMEVDTNGGDGGVVDGIKDGDTTHDSIVAHERSIDELAVKSEPDQSNVENENDKNSTFEEHDDNEENNHNPRGAEDVPEAIKETIGHIEITPTEMDELNISKSADAAQMVTNIEVMSHSNDDAVISNTKDAATINSDVPSSEVSKTTTQNSTIALLDEWEDTEDSSSQDKNCQTAVAVKGTTDAVNKLINDDWDDDD